MRYLGIIPARGGSKRLPRKNVKDFCGKPLIAWTIEAALKSTLDDIIVSTEDTEIGDVAQDWGGWVPFLRPQELATDDATTVSVIKHAALWFIEHRYAPNAIVILQPTSPLRTANDIDQGLDAYEHSNAIWFASGKGKPDGAFYAAQTEHYFANGPIDWTCVDLYKEMIDVDTLQDFEDAQTVMRMRCK